LPLPKFWAGIANAVYVIWIQRFVNQSSMHFWRYVWSFWH